VRGVGPDEPGLDDSHLDAELLHLWRPTAKVLDSKLRCRVGAAVAYPMTPAIDDTLKIRPERWRRMTGSARA